MLKKIMCESRWHKGDKRCRIVGEKEFNDGDYTFRIYGWNPLPCKSFVGSYEILARWLVEQGWEREFNNNIFLPDATYLHIKPEY